MKPTPTEDMRITDLQSGVDFLSHVPLADSVAAEQRFILFLDGLIAHPPAVNVLFSLLEHARQTIGFAEEEMVRTHHNKPLPLAEDEEVLFQQVVTVWDRMVEAYALCARLQPPDKRNPESTRQLATILHRCLYYTGMIILEHFRAHRELPAGIWLRLHAYFEAAEAQGLANTPVKDVLENNLQSTHCTAAYVTLLLVDIAGAYSHSVHNLTLIRRWAALWASLVSVQKLDDDDEVPPYFIEFSKDLPLHQMGISEGPGVGARCLDTTRLGLQINHMLGQLYQRMSPAQLGLGEESNAYVVELLTRLNKPWTQAASPRRFRRFTSSGEARVCGGFATMYFHMNQQAFVQPGDASPVPGDFPLDQWSVINHSVTGFRLVRAYPGQRVAHGQLLALWPHDGEHFLLCRANWLMQEAKGVVVAGVSVLPGIPKGIAVKVANTGEKYAPGFLLSPIPAIKEEGSLVLPLAMCPTRSLIDVHTAQGEKLQLRLLNVIERGIDYERISYEAA